MRGRRSVIVAVALVLGVVAGGAAYAFLHNVQQRAYNGAKLADVYVASGTIPKGATGAAAVGAGLITKSEIPAKFRPAGTVTDLATIQAQVATADIPTGQVVVGGLFASPAAVAGTAAQSIPKGDVAITVSVDPVHGVANLPQPGDQVDILFTHNHGSQEAFLYQNVPVLAVGTTLANHPTQATATAATTGAGGQAAGGQAAAPAPAPVSNLVTFAVPPDAAARIAYVQEGLNGDGGLYLALVPPGNAPVVPVPPPVDNSNVVPVTPVPR
ncbi:MAG TPA: Flp pilus assembly protein CpaB [Acidimicrobiales bacterium]|nr:Flp pilus assembly protein CpaB [Acidimicrobiales bacterium]